MAMEQAAARTPEREAFYDRIGACNMAPLWERLHGLVTAQPTTPCQPAIWHYREIRPYLMQSGGLITAQEATRRVLILGSGDIVHNLRVMDFNHPDGYDWAVRFNDEVKKRIRARDHLALVAYESLGPDARLAVPTPEHYLPLLYVLALQGENDEAAFFNDEAVMGSVSMTSLVMGS